MTEVDPSASVAYWNMLYSSPPEKHLEYIRALASLADTVIVAECPDTSAKRLDDEFEHVSFSEGLRFKGHNYGIAVINKQFADVRRFKPWDPLQYQAGIFSSYDDHRDVTRTVVENIPGGPIAVYAGHVTHPHHIWRPGIGMRRTIEWREHAQLLTDEELPWLWMADTNTFLAGTVSRRLGLGTMGARLLNHRGGPTWSSSTDDSGKRLYLDRVAASEELAVRATLQTLPHELNGIPNPSDHRAILATVS